MIPWILTQGIGFSPGSVKYMPTLGFGPWAPQGDPEDPPVVTAKFYPRMRRRGKR